MQRNLRHIWEGDMMHYRPHPKFFWGGGVSPLSPRDLRVRFEPSSLPADGPPPIAAATRDQRSRLATFRLRNDLYCVEWGVKLYSLTHSPWRCGGLLSGYPTALPALSLRAEGMEVLVRPPCTGWVWEASFPSLVVVMSNEGNSTRLVTFAS